MIYLKKAIMKKMNKMIFYTHLMNIVYLVIFSILTYNKFWKINKKAGNFIIEIGKKNSLEIIFVAMLVILILNIVLNKLFIKTIYTKVNGFLKKITKINFKINIDSLKTDIYELDEILLKYKKMTDEIYEKKQEIRLYNKKLELKNNELLKDEIKIKSKKNELRQIIDIIPYKVFVKDEDGVFLLVNKATASGYGLTASEMEGEKHIIIHAKNKSIPMDEVKDFLEDDREVIRTGKTKFIPEEENHENDGTIKIMQTIKVPFETMDTKKKVMLGVAVDITDQKKMQKELEIKNKKIENSLRIIEEKNLELEASYQQLAAYNQEIEELNKKKR